MCRSENEPNGPYRCSADMKHVLLSTKAHYAQAVQDVQSLKTQVETVKNQTDTFRKIVDDQGDDVPSQQIDALEKLEQNQQDMESELARLQKKAGDWQNKLREAQRNYDSTRGGMQDLSGEYNYLKNLREDSEDEEEQERLDRKIAHLKSRIDSAIGTMKEERKNPLAEEAEKENATEGIDFSVIDNTKESESVPDGTEADILIHPEVDKALDFMIDDLELSAVDKKYMGIIDPDTGEMFDEHEIQVISKQQRREARMRLKRQREADKDGREMMRSFLRSALYRALRYNKMTRHIVRLVGVKHYNDFLEKIDEIVFERKDRKLAIAKEKWKKQRTKVADSEYAELEKVIQKDREKYDSKIKQVESLYEQGDLPEPQYQYLKTSYETERDAKIKQAELAQTEIDQLRSEWAMEEMEDIKANEARMENIRQAMIARKRQKEKIQELMQPVGA